MQLQPSALDAPLNAPSNSADSSNAAPSNSTDSSNIGLRGSPTASDCHVNARNRCPTVDAHGVHATLSGGKSDAGDRHAHSTNAVLLNLVKGVLANADIALADRAKSLVKILLPPFARRYVTTTAPFLVTVLACQSFLGIDNPNLDQQKPTVVIPETHLRSLFMKALVWFIDHECVAVDGAVIVFVGRAVTSDPVTRIGFPVEAARKLATEHYAGSDDDEFDARMFHAGNFYAEPGLWFGVAAVGFSAVIGPFILVFLYHFLRDVAKQFITLALLPYPQ